MTRSANITIPDLAAGLGVSKQRVYQLRKQGMPTDSLAAAQAWRKANIDHARKEWREAAQSTDDGEGGNSSHADYWKAKAEREATEAQLAALKLAETEGQLVRIDDVRSALAARVSGVRDALRQIPARVAPELVAADTQAACYEIVEREIDQALASLTDEV